MTYDERLEKTIRKTNSAIVHATAMYEDTPDEEVNIIIGHLNRALDMLREINQARHNDGQRFTQMELFT